MELAGTCHQLYGLNYQVLLCATLVWNSNQCKGQHRKSTQKKKILQMGLEPAIAKIFPLPVWGKDCLGQLTFTKL